MVSHILSAFYLTNFSQFQSTLSVRRATSLYVSFVKPQTDFNPRSPWGERLMEIVSCIENLCISIHALREESDFWENRRKIDHFGFQSTLSVRRATEYAAQANIWWLISIHALREESDCCLTRWPVSRWYFNPRSPWGERLNTNRYYCSALNFNQRSPRGERPLYP